MIRVIVIVVVIVVTVIGVVVIVATFFVAVIGIVVSLDQFEGRQCHNSSFKTETIKELIRSGKILHIQ